MMNRFLVILFFLLLIVEVSKAQDSFQTEIDNLKALFIYVDEDNPKEYVTICNKLAWEYRDIRADSSLYYATLALLKAQLHGFKSLEIESINYSGIAYRNLGNLTQALQKYLLALDLSEKEGIDEQRGYTLINIGNLYQHQTNFNTSIEYLEKAVNHAKFLRNDRMLGYAYNNLGKSYKGLEDYRKATEYYKRAIAIRKVINAFSEEVSSKIDLVEVFYLQGDLTRAENYSLDILLKLRTLKKPRKEAELYNSMAKIKLAQGDQFYALKFAKTALKMSEEVDAKFEKMEILLTLSEIYKSVNNYTEAYKYHLLYSEGTKILLSEEIIRKTEQLINQHETHQQLEAISYLEKHDELNEKIIKAQRIIIIISIILISIVLILAFITYRGYRIKRRLSKELLKSRNEIAKDKAIIEIQSKKLQELDKAKSRFFANLSHDLRSPLSLILGNLEILKSRVDLAFTTDGLNNIETALKNCKRLLYLTDEINDLTRLEEGRVVLKLVPVNIQTYLKLLTDMFVSNAAMKGVDFVFKGEEEGELKLKIDPRQFEKIFYNLASNAIRHTSNLGSIAIGLESQGSDILISISDTGEGISKQSLPHIFDRFYQSKASGYQAKEGLGIGLALVKELVELHGASIVVQSELGKGTRFEIRFKKEDIDGVRSLDKLSFDYVIERKHLYDEIDKKDTIGLILRNQNAITKTLLVVDDNPEIRYHLRLLLEDDYDIVECAHGAEAMELLNHNDIDLIITDLMMPWMDGFELIGAIKASIEFNNIPIIVITASISEKDHEKVLGLGADHYIRKPINQNELKLLLKNTFEEPRQL
ncbi:MAG: signal transduction histidine kinase/CheY-like chemotaxis protein [Marinoscillum sp.]|jgi:signal transduction histidine kinase/CheY-like chemotaxis protein